MTEKSPLAQALDTLMSKAKTRPEAGDGDDLNKLPLPDAQYVEVGQIIWQWIVCDGSVVVQATWTADNYRVNFALPESPEATWEFDGATAKAIGQALLSAWSWETVWKLHAGELLMQSMSAAESGVVVEGTE